VTATSAVVCVTALPDLRVPPPTLINATFVNEEYANIHLQSYSVHFNDPRSGVADFTADIPGNPELIGGLCTDGFTRCAVNADCAATSSGSGGGGSTGSATTCNHSETTVGGLVLLDGTVKQHFNPELYGQTLSLTLTFVGEDDANQTFVVDGGYAVVFSDSPLLCVLTGVESPTATPVATFTGTPLPTAIPTTLPTATPGT
jgi:hypothetical protein